MSLASVSSPVRGHAALRRGRVSLPGHVYLVTFVTQDRRRLFAEFRLACAAARCLADPVLLADNRLLAWVLMPDHVHCLVLLGGSSSLFTVVARVKSGMARCVNRVRAAQGAVWARGYHDHAMRRDEDLRRAAQYLIDNPVRAGLSSSAGNYPFWNSIWV